MPNTPPEEPSDNELLARLADGDPMSLRMLMDRYDRLIRFTVHRVSRQRCLRDPQWLDSVASEVWTDLCRSSRTNPGVTIENVPSYFIQITRRRCIDALRRPGQAFLANAGAEELAQLQPTDSNEDAPSIVEEIEEISALRDCIGVLDESDRLLFAELGAITSGQWREAGGRLGLPESTLRSRWSRILAKLRRCMDKKNRNFPAPNP